MLLVLLISVFVVGGKVRVVLRILCPASLGHSFCPSTPCHLQFHPAVMSRANALVVVLASPHVPSVPSFIFGAHPKSKNILAVP